jgi:hypothetical protein
MRVEERQFAWELMRVEKRELGWEFSQLSRPSQTRTRVAWELMKVEKREFAWELMRVEKREFAWEFSHLSCPGQTRTRVAWELMRVEKREFVWELMTVGYVLPAKRAKTLINSHQNLNQFKVDESWRSNASESCIINSHPRLTFWSLYVSDIHQLLWCRGHNACLSAWETRVQSLVGPLLKVLK